MPTTLSIFKQLSVDVSFLSFVSHVYAYQSSSCFSSFRPSILHTLLGLLLLFSFSV